MRVVPRLKPRLRMLLQRVPAPARRAAVAVVPGGALLVALAQLGAFHTRVTQLPELPPAPSPWLVQRAVAQNDAACQLSVRVHDASGAAIDDATLHFAKLGQGTLDLAFDGITDRKGTHRIIDLARGSYDVTVDIPGKALQGTPTFRCEHDGQRGYFDVEVQDSDRVVEGTLRGRGQRPLAYATVALFQDLADRNALSGVVRVRTDGDGHFAARLPAGDYVAYATAAEHVAQKATLRVREAKTVMNLALAYSPAVHGVVVDDAGVPLKNAVVAMGNAFDPRAKAGGVLTDSEGRFTLPVQEGQELTLTARGDGKIGRAFVGVVDDVDALGHVRIVASAGRTITGVVTAASGDPIAFGGVQFRIRSLGVEGTAPTDEHGRFSLDGMPQNEPVEVWAKGNATGAWGARVIEPSAQPTQLALLYIPAAY